MTVRAAIDVGGTFTDLALHDTAAGRLFVGKVLSTADPSEGVQQGFEELLRESEVQPGDIAYLAHASTVASNLVIERSGDRTAVLTTRGFRDVLHLQRQKRADLYDLFYDKPEPLVRRRDIHEVTERVLADGSVHVPLDEDEVAALLRGIQSAGIRSVAVTLLHAYANPGHERRIAAIARDTAPELLISLSSEVAPRWREYERASTTAMNAYVAPRVSGYLDRIQRFFRSQGVRRPLHVMQCSGGVLQADAVRRHPVSLIESGPAAGALLGGYIGRMAGRQLVIPFDMGGTTAKVSIVRDGEPLLAEDFEIAPVTKLRPGSGLPVTVPAVDLIEIGTGGGSIAHLETGVLTVGPQSAGAAPGPACYGLGGRSPTVTDANLVLGFLDPHAFLGGRLRLDADAARAAICEHVARPLDLSVEDAAHAIHTIANTSMANAARIVTIQRGLDPRDFTMVAFGGAGPSHVAAIAREVGIREVLVPAHAGIASALGLLVARLKSEYSRTLVTSLDGMAQQAVNDVFEELERRAAEDLAAAHGDGGTELVRHVRMRYVGQGYEISVPVRSGRLEAADLLALRQAFLDHYTRLYGYADPDEPLEIVDWRLSALGPPIDAAIPPIATLANASGRRTRPVYLGSEGFADAEVWDRPALVPGRTVEGPAVIQEAESTTVLPPGSAADVDALGNLVITIRESAR